MAVNGGQLLDVAASVAAQVIPGHCRADSARVHTFQTVWLYSHPYSQAGRHAGTVSDDSRQVEQVSGTGRRWPTGVLIFARQGLGVRVPSAPLTTRPYRAFFLPRDQLVHRQYKLAFDLETGWRPDSAWLQPPGEPFRRGHAAGPA